MWTQWNLPKERYGDSLSAEQPALLFITTPSATIKRKRYKFCKSLVQHLVRVSSPLLLVFEPGRNAKSKRASFTFTDDSHPR